VVAAGVGFAMEVGSAAAAGGIGEAAAARGLRELPVWLDGQALVCGRLTTLSFMGTTHLRGGMVLKKKSKAENLMASKMWDRMW
jgi:hypothetical protein